MKLYKVFAIALAALTMTACSDDKDVNTAADVTVAMKLDKMSVSEDYSAGTYYYVPVIVEGQTNGPVKVTLQIEEFGDSPATEGENFLVTSSTIIIPEGEVEGGVEFYPVSNDDINPDRQFAVTIVKAEGASIGDQNTTVVTLIDNDIYIAEAYEKIQGEYKFESSDPDDTCTLTVVGHEEGEEGYHSSLTVYGFMGVNWVEIEVGFTFDASRMMAQMIFEYGQWCATEVSFNGLGVCDVMFAGVADGYLVSSGSVIADVAADYSSVSIPASAEFVGALFDSASGSFTGKVWFWYDHMKMTRI